MKLLFLSTGGKSNEPEDAAYLDLFLASFAKYVVPHFECKMLLLNTFAVEDVKAGKIQHRANGMGLADIVDVRTIREMQLPERSYEFLRGQSWYSNIGLHMNMLYDYAKMNNFFDADWIFHTDTDIEFLPNFNEYLNSIHPLTTLNNRVMITVTGDAYPTNFYYKNNEYIFEGPRRLMVYDEAEDLGLPYTQKTIRINPNRQHPRQNQHALIFNFEQQKVRNDFVGFSREAADNTLFNWVPCGYHEHFLPYNPENPDVGEQQLHALWSENQQNTTLPLFFNLSQDKGATVQYEVQADRTGLLRLQLRGYTDMARHFSSGYVDFFVVAGENFRQYSHRRLQEDFREWESVWAQDYP